MCPRVVRLFPVIALLIPSASALTARAAEVRVLDPAGNPVREAGVVCLGREKGDAVTGEDGVARVPDACRRVHCETADFVPAQAAIVDGKALCRLTAGVIVTAAPLPPACAAERGCQAAIRSFGGAVVESDSLRLNDPDRPPSWGPQRTHLRFKIVPPGRYRFLMSAKVGPEAWWSCEADLGTLAAGKVRVEPVWRDPARVTVRAGRPGLRVVVARRLRAPDPPGAWECSSADYGPDVVTGADGGAEVLVDPGRPFVLELHDPGRDAPVARRAFDAPPEGVVDLAPEPAR